MVLLDYVVSCDSMQHLLVILLFGTLYWFAPVLWVQQCPCSEGWVTPEMEKEFSGCVSKRQGKDSSEVDTGLIQNCSAMVKEMRHNTFED